MKLNISQYFYQKCLNRIGILDLWEIKWFLCGNDEFENLRYKMKNYEEEKRQVVQLLNKIWKKKKEKKSDVIYDSKHKIVKNIKFST